MVSQAAWTLRHEVSGNRHDFGSRNVHRRRSQNSSQGWYYTFQLKGCEVFATDGEYIGIITDVLDSGGGEILKVDRGNEETLIPFAQSYLRNIDLNQRRIEVDLPEDLRDLNK